MANCCAGAILQKVGRYDFFENSIDTAAVSLYNNLANRQWVKFFPQEKENFKKPVDNFGKLVYNIATEITADNRRTE